jgi:hypothetical protein
MRTRLVALLVVAGCRPPAAAPVTGAPITEASSAPPAPIVLAPVAPAPPPAAEPARPVVRLRWQTSGYREKTDAHGAVHYSVALDLVVDGGVPGHVSLGRRAAAGFTCLVPQDDAGVLAHAESYIEAHGEYADVTRPSPGELHVDAFGQDEALPGWTPPVTNRVHAVVRIPEDADVVFEENAGTDDAG